MKKQQSQRRLKLHRETIRSLSLPQLKRAAGAMPATDDGICQPTDCNCYTLGFTCEYTCGPHCIPMMSDVC